MSRKDQGVLFLEEFLENQPLFQHPEYETRAQYSRLLVPLSNL